MARQGAVLPQHLVQSVRALPYADQTRVINDVKTISSTHTTLLIRVGQLVLNNGEAHKLVYLSGTIPMYYKSVKYNVPVDLWFPIKYPNQGPTCYVRPTRDMRIRARHHHVDDQGVIYLRYLNEWGPSSSPHELVRQMSTVFSKNPPLYAVPSSTKAAVQPRAYRAMHGGSAAGRFNPQAAQQHQPHPSSAAAAGGHAKPLQPVAVTAATRKAQLRAELVQQVTAKLQKSLGDENREITHAMDASFATQAKLEKSQDALEQKIKDLKSEKEKLEKTIVAIDTNAATMTGWLAKHESATKVDPGEMVYCKDSWSQQLVAQVAKDHAYSDVIYTLDKALADERIDVTAFLKQVRKISRKQFLARALCSKIKDKLATLPAEI